MIVHRVYKTAIALKRKDFKQYKPEREIIEKEEKDYRYLEKMRHAHKGQDSTMYKRVL